MAADAFDEDDYPKGTVTFLFTDVVESSRLWDEHHDAMQLAMAGHDEIVKRSIAENAGVFLKQTGDGVFAVFASALDALDGALVIRSELTERSWGSIAALDVRIGLHTGEAELRDQDYFGPAVSRAARVMGIADAGEVLLSLATEEVVRDRLPVGFVLSDLGERELRGFARAEHVFRLASADDEADRDAVAVTRPSEPDHHDENMRRAAWIAVLPFENLSGDPDQEYFADGITDELITGLAAWRSLRVIARTSSFRYRGSDAGIPEIAEDLGVGFVIEGSVKKAGSRVRVTAQLIDVTGHHHIWADRYDADLVDVFAVQDQITQEIVVAIDPAIRDAEVARVSRVGPENMDAWDHVQRGTAEFYRIRPDANAEARHHFEAAIELDPSFAGAHAGLSRSHYLDGWLDWVDDPRRSAELAVREAKMAVEADNSDAMSHAVLALANFGIGRMGAALQAAERAIELNPSLTLGHLMGGAAKVHDGDPEGGIPMITDSIALNPRDPLANWGYGVRAIGHFLLREHERAIADARAGIKLRYGYLLGRVMLVASLADMGRVADSRHELETMLEIHPDFTPAKLDRYVFADEADRDRIIGGLRSAGLQT